MTQEQLDEFITALTQSADALDRTRGHLEHAPAPDRRRHQASILAALGQHADVTVTEVVDRG